MKRVLPALSILLFTSATSVLAAPTSYMGSLAAAGGGGDGVLTVSGAVWNSPLTTLSWTVDNVTTPGMWHYSYTLQTPGPGAAISHMIFEVSDGDPGPAFTGANLHSLTSTPNGWIDELVEIGQQVAGAGNPNMPSDLYGIKVNAASEAVIVTISFDSDRSPVWGDFYAKDGVQGGVVNTVYNAGFADPDPLTAPHDGSEDNHLLVPDSTTVQVPVPGAALLAALGIGLVGRIRRFRIS